MNPSFSLGPRLNSIFELVIQVQQQNPYMCIWDCCCDHGYLGIKILSENLCDRLVFVDQVPHIMEQLAARLASLNSDKHLLITADASDLCFDSQQRHLLIFAGVGGERTVDIIGAIEARHPDAQLDYIFCPSTSQHSLRDYLAEGDFGLAFERLVLEKGRYYEMLYVQGKAATSELPRVSKTCHLWDDDDPDHQRYLGQLSQHEHQKRPRGKQD